ncbi:MAG TPA: hypothetical protein VLB85_00810 [Acidimicrobiia bacterium]|nr:hypothetical protein [Acidimicrobiia bacterium]
MIAVFCDEIHRRVLVPLDDVEAIRGADGRLTVGYRCACGRPGEMLTGRRRAGGEASGHRV